jgi:hypothetical protein
MIHREGQQKTGARIAALPRSNLPHASMYMLAQSLSGTNSSSWCRPSACPLHDVYPDPLSVMLYILVASPSRYFRHSILDLSTSTNQRIATEKTPSPRRKVKGMFLLPERSMMAADTNGPMNDDVLPIIENMAKKRNCTISVVH